MSLERFLFFQKETEKDRQNKEKIKYSNPEGTHKHYRVLNLQ